MDDEFQNPERAVHYPSPEVRVIAPLCIAGFSGLLSVSVLGPFVAIVAAELNVSVPMIGYTATASLLMTAVSGLFIGWLSDVAGFRRVLVFGLGLLAASGAFAALAATYVMFIAARMVGSIGFAAATGLPNAIVSTRYQGSSRQQALGYISGASILAGLIGPPVLTFVGDLTSWRVAFALVGGFALVAGAGVRLTIPSPAPAVMSPPSVADGVNTYRKLLSSSTVRLLLLATLLQMAGLIGAIVYVGAYLTDVVGLSVRFVGFAFAAQSLGGITASFVAGRLAESRTRSAYVLAMTGLAIAVAGIYVLTPPFALILGLIYSAGFSQVIGWIVLVGMLARSTPVGQGSTMVFNGSVLGIGGAIGTAAGGLVIGTVGYSVLGIVFSLAAVGSGVALWMAVRSVSVSSN